MSFNALLNTLLRRVAGSGNGTDDASTPYQANTSKLSERLLDVFLRTFDLGFTAFGGPPVHFQIFHRRFVDGIGKTPWIDEQTYQELFAISQALPGPASTKMLFNIAHIHAGHIPAMFVFLLWSLPGAIAMYGLSLGVEKISETLPAPAYALLSGLNAATVGIIALAAVQLARKAITDPLTRVLVLFGGSAGLCYNALWYFPVLLVAGGAVTWPTVASSSIVVSAVPHTEDEATVSAVQPSRSDISAHRIPAKIGLLIILAFFATFTAFMVTRGVIDSAPLLLALFNNMFLAGTVIFGGGPVVIPLLRDYVVDPGWVLPRDFLLGLAVIQALPGPNFNFAIYLGALAVTGPASSKSIPTIVGALLAFLGVFTPGLWLSVGFQSIWQSLRRRREVASVLRGVNAAAVGFVFTAVYRLWEIGYITPEESRGSSLAKEPWWLVVAAATFTVVEWFSTPPPLAILAGGVAGIGWWAAIARRTSFA
ncbi:hypothetical protein NLJ89_g91 [Agrocybe chaxingu]|uniref:Chromate transporter n=1 Tax=Agrocybe chaxingu TaxID=84603 RepID=A0A9W8TGV2_9AGAR|nr:hypothetical protein NLJ89_g91 [Agrocybe chaxingu]